MENFEFEYLGKKYQGRLTRSRYVSNNATYIGVESWDEEGQYYEPWCDLTTNLDWFIYKPNMITIKDGEDYLVKILKKLKVIKKIILMGIPQGWNTYTCYEIDLKKLNELSVELK